MWLNVPCITQAANYLPDAGIAEQSEVGYARLSSFGRAIWQCFLGKRNKLNPALGYSYFPLRAA